MLGQSRQGLPSVALPSSPTPHAPDRATFVKLKSDQGPSLSELQQPDQLLERRSIYLTGQGLVLLKKVGVSLQVRSPVGLYFFVNLLPGIISFFRVLSQNRLERERNGVSYEHPEDLACNQPGSQERAEKPPQQQLHTRSCYESRDRK